LVPIIFIGPVVFLEEDQKQTTPYLTPLALGFLLLLSTSDEQRKHKLLKEPSNEHSYEAWFHLAQ
jgi:hypothetical protein